MAEQTLAIPSPTISPLRRGTSSSIRARLSYLMGEGAGAPQGPARHHGAGLRLPALILRGMAMTNEEMLRRSLSSLHDERTRDYEVRITDLATRNCTPESIQSLSRIAEDLAADESLRYSAFYALSIIYRRLDDYEKLDELMQEYSDDFSDHPTFNHLELLSKLDRGDYSNPYALLAMARADAEHFKRNAGFAHLYADLFATVFESHAIVDTRKYLERWYQSALAAAQHAIELDPGYAKFYCTRARIYAIGEFFDEADHDIQQAISLEDSSRLDYAVRLQRYHYYKLKFDSGREIIDLKRRVENLEAIVKRILDDVIDDDGAGVPDVNAYEGPLPYAFLSYSHKDSQQVFDLVKRLQERGVRIWFDKGINPGEGWEEELVVRLDEADAVLFCLSGNTKESKEVSKEVSLAAASRKLPICVDYEPNCLGTAQRYQLESLQHIMSYELDPDTLVEKVYAALPSTVK